MWFTIAACRRSDDTVPASPREHRSGHGNAIDTLKHRLFYDQLLVWMIPQTRNQMLFLSIKAWIAFFYVRYTYITLWASAPYLLAGVYLPAFLIILWQQQFPQRIYQRFAAVPSKLL
jgi:hypothetical protein